MYFLTPITVTIFASRHSSSEKKEIFKKYMILNAVYIHFLGEMRYAVT